MSNPKATAIARLNDQFRTSVGTPEQVPIGMVTITPGISRLPTKDHNAILDAVRAFDTFEEGNDPYYQHDFGAISMPWGAEIFWKIDYYGLDMNSGAEDPSDPAKTIRVLTIMLSEEY